MRTSPRSAPYVVPSSTARLSPYTLLVAFGLLVLACAPDAPQPTTPPPETIRRDQEACEKNGDTFNGTVTCVEITGTVEIDPTATTQLTCDGYNALGFKAIDNVTRSWTFSGDPRVAEIVSTTTSKTITVAARGPGSIIVTCTFPNAAAEPPAPASGSISVRVTGTRRVATVTLGPTSISMPVGENRPLTVTYSDQFGHTGLVSPTSVQWFTSRSVVAYAQGPQVFSPTGGEAGTAEIWAVADSKESNRVAVTVTTRIATLTTPSIDTDLDLPLTRAPQAFDAAGLRVTNVLYTGSVANPGIATIDCSQLDLCRITPLAVGTTTYTVTGQGRTASASLTVRATPPVFTQSMTGPRSVRAGQTCVWSTTVGGGRPPYRIDWFANGIYMGQGTSMSYTVNTSVSPVYVQNIVLDALGRRLDGSINVSISPTARLCQF